MKITTNKIAFLALTIALGFYAVPTQANKTNGVLRMSLPVETPDGVHISWTGGQTNTTYSVWRRLYPDGSWERIRMGLQGVSGATTIEGFTLDRTWTYELRADTP